MNCLGKENIPHLVTLMLDLHCPLPHKGQTVKCVFCLHPPSTRTTGKYHHAQQFSPPNIKLQYIFDQQNLHNQEVRKVLAALYFNFPGNCLCLYSRRHTLHPFIRCIKQGYFSSQTESLKIQNSLTSDFQHLVKDCVRNIP